jgi:predicted ATPase/DNA-binding SARP family transcriptional activator
MSKLEISLFGTMQVSVDGRPVPRFESAKVRALLAYLAAEAGKPQSRARLAGLLWPDWPEEAAQKNLRHTLYSLRKALGDPECLEADRQTVTLIAGEACQVDCLELEGALAKYRGSRAAVQAVEGLRAAAEQYRGAFLEGFTLDDSPAFEEWVLNRREHHTHQVLELWGLLAGWHEEQGEHEQAEAYARKQLAIEPWNEGAHRTVMSALVMRGERAAALAQYESLKRVLYLELKAEPSIETIKLEEKIRIGALERQQSPTGDEESTFRLRPVKHNLPQQLTSFIGREQEIADVQAFLTQYRLVTITGPGGVGKTRLVLQAANGMLASFPDGVWYIELAPISNPENLLHIIFQTLGLMKEKDQTIEGTLLSFLRSRQSLLILDNCEHLIDEIAQLVESMLRNSLNLKILASSREPLQVGGEAIENISSMKMPEPSLQYSLDDFQALESVSLFIERANAVLHGFQLTASDMPIIAKICRHLDGIPLALELAVVHLNMFTLTELLSHLDDTFRLLAGGARTASPRHRTLRSAIDWSYNLLDEGEKILLLRLAVFSGSFDLDDVEQVCSGDGLAIQDIFGLLASLIHKSLVLTLSGHQGGTRYRLLEMIRQYASEKLAEGGLSIRLRMNHLDHYLRLAEKAESGLISSDRPAWNRRLEAEMPNLRLAVDWA